MKKYFIVLQVCFFSQFVKGQCEWQIDSIMYVSAYKYIISDSININYRIAVSDSIVDLYRGDFSDINLSPKVKERLNKYRMMNSYKYLNPYYSKCLTTLFGSRAVENPNKILFFSRIEENILRADLLIFDDKRICKRRKFDYYAYFGGEGSEYLFIFNALGEIEIVLKRSVIYD